MKLKFLALLALPMFISFTSCSKKFTVYFEKETPDVVPDDEGLYKGVKSFYVKSANQTIVYSDDKMSSSINIMINTIERELVKKGLQLKADNADIVIEVIGIEPREYSTNRTQTEKGKTRVFTDCSFDFTGNSAFVKVIKGQKSVSYTFYTTPCVNGCSFEVGRDCKRKPVSVPRKEKDAVNEGFSTTAKNNPLLAESLGKQTAMLLLSRIDK